MTFSPLDVFCIEGGQSDRRLDKLLADRFAPQFSRTYFADLIEQGLILVNGKPIKKRAKLQEGDHVEICFTAGPELDLKPEAIPLNILYEDRDLLVVNKPAGMVVHPAVGNWSGTFVNALLHHCHDLKNMDDKIRPGIVHRLDKDTTGLLVAAKHLEAQKRLIECFASRQVYKEYLAIAWGKPREGRIETLIGRDPQHRQKMAVVETGGKSAVSEMKVLRVEKGLSLVQIILHTGRTHQIRVHLQYLKAPVLGDPIYGAARANKEYNVSRPLLHAWKLKLPHPMTGARLELAAPLPQEFFILSDIPLIG